MSDVKVNLREFLVRGQLGPVEPGMSRDRIRALLGEPETWGLADAIEQAPLWKYGSLELGFDGDRVAWIRVYLRNPLTLPASLVVQGYFPSAATSLAEFEQYLSDAGLAYQIDPDLTFDSQIALAVASRVTVVADAETQILDSIQYAPLSQAALNAADVEREMDVALALGR